MTDPGLPLTTGEGNTANWGVWLSDQQGLGGVKLTEEEAARLAHDLFAVLAECERLRELVMGEGLAFAWRSLAFKERAKRKETEQRLREQLDAARPLIVQADEALDAVTLELGSSRGEKVYAAQVAVHAARAALGVEGPAAGDGQP